MSQAARIDSSIAPIRADAAGRFRLIALAATLVLAIAIGDFATFNINLAVVYLIPLLLISRLNRSRLLWEWSLGLVALAYLGYFAGVRSGEVKNWHDLVNFRLVNRTLEAVAILCSTALLHINIGLRELRTRRGKLARPGDIDEQVFDQILASFDRFFTTILCVMLVALVMLTDVLTPPQFNIPILFSLPLVALGRTQNRAMVWLMVPLLLLLAAVGLYLGPRPIPTHIKEVLIFNRAIACLVLVGVAIILHLWIGSRATRSAT